MIIIDFRLHRKKHNLEYVLCYRNEFRINDIMYIKEIIQVYI